MKGKYMFIVVNVILVAAAFMLILVIAATSSIPSRQASDMDAPEGDWMGPAVLPRERQPRPAPASRAALRRQVAAASVQ